MDSSKSSSLYFERMDILKANRIILTLFSSLIFLFTLGNFAKSSNFNELVVGKFSSVDLEGWKNKVFAGETNYQISQENGEYFLQAESDKTASALYKKINVDITKTPYLNWSWRIDHALPILDEKNKKSDDFAARIYVVFKTGFTPLSAKALNYVWSSGDQTDTHWPNPYTDKAIMIPIRCNLDEAEKWMHEKVNVKKDLLKYFNKVPNKINGIAIMTDTDNTKYFAKASYGDIYFSSK